MIKNQDTPAMKQALLDLFDKDDSKVRKALKKITRDGNASHMPALFDLYIKVDDGSVKDELDKMLRATKLAGADEVLVELLIEPRFKDHQEFILACLWHSGYQPVEHLDVIVGSAIRGDYMTAFEALTVIENLEPPFDMDVLTVAAIDLSEHLDVTEADDKTVILEKLKTLLEEMKTSVMSAPEDIEGEG